MQTPPRKEDLSAKLADLTRPVVDLEQGLLASAFYDGDLKVAVLKFYDEREGRFHLWRDTTGHKPYCFTRLPLEELAPLRGRKDVVTIEEEEKLDLLNDSKVKVRKIITTDPLAIGGGSNSIRDEIRAWEADIKYYENFVYDRGLQMGTYYRIAGGRILPSPHKVPPRVALSLDEILKRNRSEFEPYLKGWAELLGEPLCDFKRIALDIEVANEAGRLPDAEDPRQPVIAVSFFNERESLVFLLRNGKDTSGMEGKPYSLVIFDDEVSLLRAVMSKIMDYPVLVTFNGDNFDLRYLRHRAEKLGIGEEENPIQLERVAASLKHGAHIDLYQFFRNRSIQVYAFGNRYTEHTLNAISEAIIDKSKVEFEGEIGDLPLPELAEYCLNDSRLTYELTSAGDSLVMKLLLVISRIGRMPINDVSRLGVSNWIRSMLFFEHRKIGALIPRQDELAEKGGASSQAIIKGKKYKGGLVIEPKPGVFFDVSVLDFASLYPSLIKVHNLSYETVDCPHEECRRNTIPETSSWVCERRRGIISLVTGSLRDLRVGHYKPLARDATLSKTDRDLYTVVSQGLKVFLNACFSGDTSIVTPTGIRNIREVKVGDRVVNVNPRNLKVEVDEVVEVQAFPYSGEMFHFRDGEYLDLIVTPNHRFLTSRRRSPEEGARFMTAAEVYGTASVDIPRLNGGVEDPSVPRPVSLLETARRMDAYASIYPAGGVPLSLWIRALPAGVSAKIRRRGRVCRDGGRLGQGVRSHYVIPTSEVTEEDVDSVERAGGKVFVGEYGTPRTPSHLDAVKLASLCGRLLAEGDLEHAGSELNSSEGREGKTGGVSVVRLFARADAISLPDRKEIRSLAGDLGLRTARQSAGTRYCRLRSSVLATWVQAECCLGDSAPDEGHKKRIPRFVFGSRATIESFVDSSCDKGTRAGERSFSSPSSDLAKDMAVLLSLLGLRTRIDYKDGTYRVTSRNASSRLTGAGSDMHGHVTREWFSGMVYCVTTRKNHTVIAGRNGRFVHVGQSYGVLGFDTFAFYCLPVAEATAALGRFAITNTIEKCRELGIPVIYGDTDSIFLQNPSREQIATITRWADTELGVELDLDKTYKYVAFSSRKKNYFGVLPDGSPDIKGLTGRKSQTPEYLKQTFYKALEILSGVNSPDDFERARGKMRELLSTMVSSLRDKKVPVAELAFNVMMGKPTDKYSGTTPQHVKAAQALEQTGKDIKAGDIIEYVKTKSPPFVKPVQLAKAEDIDPDKYLEYAKSMFDQILDSLDFSFDEIMGATTLDFFWGG
jgi:DNA polymerase elongation subunit (family B)